MTPEEELAEDAVRMLAAPQVFARGREYYREGRVLELVERGNQLHAEVQGNDPKPYRVTLTAEGGRVSRAECTCPYDRGSVCKHAVAALLAYFLEPKRVTKRPLLEEVLAPLERDRLQAILLELARRPELAELIEARALALQTPAAPEAAGPPRKEPPPVDAALIRKQVRAAFRAGGYRRGYDYQAASDSVDEVEQILQAARPHLEAGSGRGALTILEAVADELTENLDSLYDEEGEAYAFFEELGQLLAEAVLTADLSPEERREWERQIEEWQSRASDYGYDEAFGVARYAARQGWDYPPLQRVLQGEITERGAWEDEPAYCADELAEVRLKVLERQERWEEYLHLAEAESRTERYVTMLVRLGRIPEAVEYGLQYLDTRTEYLALARALEGAGASGGALRVAERGFAAREAGPYPTGELARWTRDLAARLGETERALQAALTVMREQPTLADYLAVQPLAGERWSEVREELLAQVRRRQSHYPSDEIDIFLHEGLIEDAMAAVDASPRHELVARVVDAALLTHPDWVFRACAHQFDRIADSGKSQYYREAVGWLEKARAALTTAGREAEWRSYLADVIARHNRKYSLRPMLERLR
jgi:uncharacterized Zn finger protein